MSDTVGFIRDLPHTLIEAFQATLQEAADADLLLHIVDGREPGAAGPDRGGSARATAAELSIEAFLPADAATAAALR